MILKDNGFTEQTLLDDTFSSTLLLLLITSAVGRLLIGWLTDRFSKRVVVTMAFIPLFCAFPLLLYFIQPPAPPYLFALLFGLATGGDFLLAALMAADQFSVTTLARVLGIMLPVMTVGQTWLPYLVAVLREQTGSYTLPLGLVMGLAVLGWVLLVLLPAPVKQKVILSKSAI